MSLTQAQLNEILNEPQFSTLRQWLGEEGLLYHLNQLPLTHVSTYYLLFGEFGVITTLMDSMTEAPASLEMQRLVFESILTQDRFQHISAKLNLRGNERELPYYQAAYSLMALIHNMPEIVPTACPAWASTINPAEYDIIPKDEQDLKDSDYPRVLPNWKEYADGIHVFYARKVGKLQLFLESEPTLCFNKLNPPPNTWVVQISQFLKAVVRACYNHSLSWYHQYEAVKEILIQTTPFLAQAGATPEELEIIQWLKPETDNSCVNHDKAHALVALIERVLKRHQREFYLKRLYQRKKIKKLLVANQAFIDAMGKRFMLDEERASYGHSLCVVEKAYHRSKSFHEDPESSVKEVKLSRAQSM